MKKQVPGELMKEYEIQFTDDQHVVTLENKETREILEGIIVLEYDSMTFTTKSMYITYDILAIVPQGY